MSIPTKDEFFSKQDPTKPDHAFLKNHFYRQGRLSEEQALYILEMATEVLKSEDNILNVEAPVTGVCLSSCQGDLDPSCLQFVGTSMGNTYVMDHATIHRL